MHKSQIFLYTLLAFIVGNFLRSFFDINENLFFILVVFSLIILAVNYKNKTIIVLFLLANSFALGIWKVDVALKNANNLPFVGKAIRENAIVIKSTKSAFGQNMTAELNKENIFVQVNAPQYPEYKYGDLLDIDCTLNKIQNKDSEFDYRMYMAKENVLYTCEKAKIEKIGEGKGSKILHLIFNFRLLCENNINRVISFPQSALASGLIFGGSSELSKEIQNDFSRTGMTHIVAVSGFNVTIIAQCLIALGIWIGLWRKNAFWFAIVGIIIFITMSGLPSSAVRAAVMSGVLLWAIKNGRISNAENGVIFAAVVMIAINPLLLRWDIGFQLSFLATIGIVMLSPFWEKSFIKKHKAFGISETLAMSISAQIFVLPIIAYNFNIASLISLLANVFILPIIPFAMLLVFLVAIAGFVFMPLSLAISWVAYILLFYVIYLVQILSSFPWASVEIKEVRIWWMVVYYLMLTAIIYFSRLNFRNLKS